MVEYKNKLVRDNIPQIIKKSGRTPHYKILDDSSFERELNNKLLEEVKEYLESQNLEEMADIMEVMLAIIEHKNFKIEDIEKVRQEKVKSNGAFTKRIYLEYIEK